MPMVSLNAWWPVPLLHWHLHSLKQQCWDMLCLPSRIPSLVWDLLLTKDAPLSLPRQQSLSTILMDISFFRAGNRRLDHASGTSLSPRRSQPPRLRPLSQRHWKPSRHHHRVLSHHSLAPFGPCPPKYSLHHPRIQIPAKDSLPPALWGLPDQSTTSTVLPRLSPLQHGLQVLPSIHEALIFPALGP